MFLLTLLSAFAADPQPGWPGGPASPPGDVFVAGPAGASVLLDGKETGLTAPTTVVGVSPGPHKVGLRKGCEGAEVLVEVRSNAIERAEATLSVPLGHISIAVNVWSAEIRVDGKQLAAPPNGPIEALCGKHVVEAVVPGYRNATSDVEIHYDETVSVVLTLVREQVGNLAIGVTPLDANVWVDGAPHGAGPMTVSALPSGMHMVEAKKVGFQTAKAPVTVTDGQTTRIDLSLLAEAPMWQRMGLNRVRWPQVGAASALTVGAGVAGVLAWTSYTSAQTGYADYAQLTYADDPEAFYAENVEAPRTMATVLTVVGGASFVGAGLLWATLKPIPETHTVSLTPMVGPTMVGARGTF